MPVEQQNKCQVGIYSVVLDCQLQNSVQYVYGIPVSKGKPSATRECNQNDKSMIVDAIHVTAEKKGTLDKTRIMQKLKKKKAKSIV